MTTEEQIAQLKKARRAINKVLRELDPTDVQAQDDEGDGDDSSNPGGPPPPPPGPGGH